MLYLEDEDRRQWPSVVRVLASVKPLDMVAILHPGDGETDFVAPFEVSTDAEFFMRPTGSPGEQESLCSRRVTVDESLLTTLEAPGVDLEEWGHTLAVYPPGSYESAAASIPHEAVIMVADEYGSAIAAAGFFLSEDAPEWW